MTQDALCPNCGHSFPITEARKAFTVVCPRCEVELTVEFKTPATPPDAGKPPYDLVVKKGGLPVAAASAPPKKVRKDDDEDEDEPKRGGGSARIAFISGGLGLLLVFLSLGLTGWFLFTQVDTETTWNRGSTNTNKNSGSNKNNNSGGNKSNAGGTNSGGTTPGTNPPPPPKPKDTFELKPVGGTPPLIVTPPDLDASAPKTVLLPGKANAVAVGGNGRYIVLSCPDQGRLVVFDANIGDLLPEGLTMENGNALVAAGANKLVVSVPNNSKKLRVYSLPGFNKESEFEVPLFFGPHSIAMGSRTNGPLLVVDGFGRVVLMDLATGKAIEATDRELKVPANQLRASPDGKMFLAGNGYGANDKFKVVDESQKKWRVLEPDIFAAYPGPDGKHIYGKDLIIEVNGNQAKQVAGRPPKMSSNVWYVPAVNATGNYFLRVNQVKIGMPPQEKDGVSIALHRDRNVQRMVLTPWEGLPETEGLIAWGNNTEPLDKHLFLIPEAKLLVILNRDKTQLVVRKLLI